MDTPRFDYKVAIMDTSISIDLVISRLECMIYSSPTLMNEFARNFVVC